MASVGVEVGRKLGHFRIVEKIGAGGMGIVYRAFDERLERDVALKVLPPGLLSDETARKRFKKEALALSKLNHPNIATIHDFDTQEGVDFLVMEFIPGMNLSDKFASRPMSEKNVIVLGIQFADGLAAAHDHGVVHRDLKPGNLRLSSNGSLKILDFGLAKLHGPTAATASTESLSATLHIAGTLAYMAPEQALGADVDPRTDIYAAGLVLYEMATGRHAFADVSHSKMLGAILNQSPPPPSTINCNVSPELERIIGKCLEKDPENRYQSSRELAVDLRRLQTGAGTVPRFRLTGPKREPKKKITVGLVLGVFILVLLFQGYHAPGRWQQSSMRGIDERRIESLAVLPLEDLSGDPQQEYFADGMTESLITDLGKLTGLKRVIARGSVMRYKGTRQPLSEIARELKVDAFITGAVMRSGNRVRVTAHLIRPNSGEQLWTEHYDRDDKDVLQLQSELTSAIAAAIRVKLTPNEQARLASVTAVNPKAYDAYTMGRFHFYKATAQGLQTALENFELAIREDPAYAPAYVGIGYVWFMRAHTGATNEGWARAKAAALKAIELNNDLAEAHDILGSILIWHEWNWSAGEKEYQRAIELDPNYANVRCFYFFFLHAMLRSREAKEQIQKALELDPYNPFFHAALGMMMLDEHRPYEATRTLLTADSLQPDNFFVSCYLSEAHEQRSDLEHAASELRIVLR